MTKTTTAPMFRSMESLLGGPSVLQARPRTAVDWVEAIRRGLPAAAVDALTESVHLTQAELSTALGISRRTLSRRKQEGLLTSQESAKLVRLAQVLERAQEVFEGLDAALEWLKTPNAALTRDTSLSLLDTDLGAELVLDTLGRIEHGVFAQLGAVLVVWRLVTARFAATAFTGEGARLYGDRWNPKGVPLVFTAATRPLALLEMLVQDDPPRARYVAIPVTIPDGVRIESVATDSLPDELAAVPVLRARVGPSSQDPSP